jgi:hypothetical protein
MREGQIGLDMEAEKIRIVVDKKTHASISLYRGSNIGRAILLNGVYLPAVMEVLRNLASEKELYELRRSRSNGAHSRWTWSRNALREF